MGTIENVISIYSQVFILGNPQRIASHHIYEAARRLSSVNAPFRPNNNLNNTLQNCSPESPKIIAPGTDVVGSTPAGYEPENSLRRVSHAAPPMSFKREGGMRRRSALDRPNVLPVVRQVSLEKENQESLQSPLSNDSGYEPEDSLHRVKKSSGQTSTVYEPENSLRRTRRASAQPVTNYEPENSLSRRRKHSEQPKHVNTIEEEPQLQTSARKTSTADGKQRRPGFIQSQTPPVLSESDLMNVRHRSKPKFNTSSSSESDSSPGTPKSPARQRHNVLSIPEHGEVKRVITAAGSLSPSPKPKRKTSSHRRRVSATKLVLTSPTSSSQANLRLSRTAASSPSLSLRSQNSSTSLHRAMSAGSPESNNSKSRKTTQREGVSHNNVSRYWEWYLLNASYSWENFNNHKTYCY